MEHGLKYIAFLCSKTYSTLHSCHNFPAGSQQSTRGTHICETSLFQHSLSKLQDWHYNLWCMINISIAGNLNWFVNLCCLTIISPWINWSFRDSKLQITMLILCYLIFRQYWDGHSVLKIRAICHAQDLWKSVWSCKELHLLCLPDLWNLPSTALLCGFLSSWGVLESTE